MMTIIVPIALLLKPKYALYLSFGMKMLLCCSRHSHIRAPQLSHHFFVRYKDQEKAAKFIVNCQVSSLQGSYGAGKHMSSRYNMSCSAIDDVTWRHASKHEKNIPEGQEKTAAHAVPATEAPRNAR